MAMGDNQAITGHLKQNILDPFKDVKELHFRQTYYYNETHSILILTTS